MPRAARRWLPPPTRETLCCGTGDSYPRVFNKIDLEGLRLLELVAELFHSHEPVHQHRELLTEPPDVNVDRPRSAGVPVSPHVAEQNLTRQHTSAVLQQILEQH